MRRPLDRQSTVRRKGISGDPGHLQASATSEAEISSLLPVPCRTNHGKEREGGSSRLWRRAWAQISLSPVRKRNRRTGWRFSVDMRCFRPFYTSFWMGSLVSLAGEQVSWSSLSFFSGNLCRTVAWKSRALATQILVEIWLDSCLDLITRAVNYVRGGKVNKLKLSVKYFRIMACSKEEHKYLVHSICCCCMGLSSLKMLKEINYSQRLMGFLTVQIIFWKIF